jgi:hypothetical protein
MADFGCTPRKRERAKIKKKGIPVDEARDRIAKQVKSLRSFDDVSDL